MNHGDQLKGRITTLLRESVKFETVGERNFYNSGIKRWIYDGRKIENESLRLKNRLQTGNGHSHSFCKKHILCFTENESDVDLKNSITSYM